MELHFVSTVNMYRGFIYRLFKLMDLFKGSKADILFKCKCNALWVCEVKPVDEVNHMYFFYVVFVPTLMVIMKLC